MNVKLSIENSVLTAHVSGDLDHHVAAFLREQVDRQIHEHMPKALVLDFSDIGFMDSSGLGFIMGRYKQMKRYGGEVSLVGVTGKTKTIIAMSGAAKYVNIQE